jgi:hypothetical protein
MGLKSRLAASRERTSNVARIAVRPFYIAAIVVTFTVAITPIMKTESDVLVGSLAPDRVFGGWAAYSADALDCQISFAIKNISRR